MEVLKIHTIDSYNRMWGVETLHPLVTVVDVKDYAPSVLSESANYGLYAVFLKEGEGCHLRYGRQKYDYQDGSIVCFSPGQTVTVDYIENETVSWKALLFHPDLLFGTHLADNIRDYHFFDYDQREALHVSAEERRIIEDTFQHIHDEMSHGVDRHSQQLLTVLVELVLDYCQRFYDRQFITRHKVNSDVLTRLEKALNVYFDSGRAVNEGVPTVKAMASEMCLSPSYFSDLVKKETGCTVQEYIQNKVVFIAKQQLAGSGKSISEIAYDLGFQYPQHFTRMFKTVTGKTPKAYRDSN